MRAIGSWWKNRGGEAIRVRLRTYEGQHIFDLGTWFTDKYGALKPGKGFACSVKHIRGSQVLSPQRPGRPKSIE